MNKFENIFKNISAPKKAFDNWGSWKEPNGDVSLLTEEVVLQTIQGTYKICMKVNHKELRKVYYHAYFAAQKSFKYQNEELQYWLFPCKEYGPNTYNVCRRDSDNETCDEAGAFFLETYHTFWDKFTETFTKGVSTLPPDIVCIMPYFSKVIKELKNNTYTKDIKMVPGARIFEDENSW